MYEYEEQVIEITKGKVEGKNCVYEFILGFCEGPVYPYITIDYWVLPDGVSTDKFAGRSPQGLVSVLTEKNYPVPAILELWQEQTKRVTNSMLSGAEDMTLDGLRQHYVKQLTEDDIKEFIRQEVSEMFQETTITLALHTYWGIRAANDWNEGLEQILLQRYGGEAETCECP